MNHKKNNNDNSIPKIITELFQIIKNDNIKKEKFLALLERGYFPRELPPPFQTKKLKEYVNDSFSLEKNAFLENILNKIQNKNRDEKISTLKYSQARPDQLRRIISVPNPVSYYLLSIVIISKFNEILSEDIINEYRENAPTLPCFNKEDHGRAFEFSKKWNERPLKRLQQRSEGRILVKTDIVRFFSSIYTHSIPWALHGKSKAKNNASNNMIGNLLDVIIRRGQDNQTLGIPTGPDTSFILSERILIEVDKLIHEKMSKDGKNINYFHWVDDYEFICHNRNDADYCIAILQEALQEFELELNSLKTEIVILPEPLQEKEIANLRNFKIEEKLNKSNLLEYYDLAFSCYKVYPKGTLKYAINKIPEYEDYDQSIIDFMMQSILIEAGVIETVLLWLSKTGHIKNIDKEKLKRCFSTVIKDHGSIKHSSEVAWAIWGFLLLQEKIPDEDIDIIIKMNDSIPLILLMDMKDKSLMSDSSSENLINKIKSITNEINSLYGPHWLLSYQAKIKDISEIDKNMDDIFKILKENNVSFYINQEIEEYQEIMKNWKPYNSYVDFDNEDLNADTDVNDEEISF